MLNGPHNFHHGLLGSLLATVMIAAVTVPAATAAPPALTDTVIQQGLSHPWDIVFLPDGRMLVSKRAGDILIFQSTDPGAPRLATIPIDGVHAEGEAGAMGITLDPDVATNGFLYLCVTRDDELEWRNQVLRYVVAGNTLMFDSFVIRRGIQAATAHDGWSTSTISTAVAISISSASRGTPSRTSTYGGTTASGTAGARDQAHRDHDRPARHFTSLRAKRTEARKANRGKKSDR